MRFAPCLLFEGHTLQGAPTQMACFCSAPVAGFYAAVDSVDDLIWADERDTLIAITGSPYRTEVVEAVQVARSQGVNVVSFSDSPASPIIRAARHGFVVARATPQFFPSSVSTTALLETLLSFVISMSSKEVVGRVEKFHKRRHQLGLYQEDYQ